ncbi:MAG: hypothetical protein AAGA38_14750 [Pseudomonadota bacterium]
MRFDEDYFPIAVIYDHIVLLPSAQKLHPTNTPAEEISEKLMSPEQEIAPRFQHNCVGPAVVLCGAQVIVQPDLIPNATVPPQYVWLDGWP